MTVLLGCISDDFTGATDLANTLVRGGMRVVQTVGIPDRGNAQFDADAINVALKTRTIASEDAVSQSLEALTWLRQLGARQFFFKYCSTFDSTKQGNIGPVISALRLALGVDITVACPAFPENARTVYQGHLFVGNRLLSESGMANHPLTPMTDSNLVRFLGRQTEDRVGLVPFDVMSRGASEIRQALNQLSDQGYQIAILDALTDEHLLAAAESFDGLRLITGGSGIAAGLPGRFRRQGLLPATMREPHMPRVNGLEVVISGSCSERTLEQVAHFRQHRPAFCVDPEKLAARDDVITQAVHWAQSRLCAGPVLIYSSASSQKVVDVQRKLGRHVAGALVEDALSRIAACLLELGARRFVIAGGETSGAVLTALQVKALRIGPQIDPGVPWTETIGEPSLALALKSGNFGQADFFLRSLEMLQ